MTVLTPQVLLDSVFKTIREQVKEQNQVHPEDVMTTVTLTAETIYQFIANFPSGTFQWPVKTDANVPESSG